MYIWIIFFHQSHKICKVHLIELTRTKKEKQKMSTRDNNNNNGDKKPKSPSSNLRLRVVIVARKADALILCGTSFDPSLSQGNSLSLQAHATRLVHAIVTSGNSTRGSLDDGDEHFCYCVKGGIVVVCALIGRDTDTQALAYCSSVAAEFVGTYGAYVANYTRDYEVSAFNDRLRTIADREDGFNRLTSEIEAVHDAVADNVRQIMIRGDKINEIGNIAEDLRDNADKYRMVSKKVNVQALWMQYKPVVIVVGVALLIIIIRILLG